MSEYGLDPYKWCARRTSGRNTSTSPRQPNRERTQALALLTRGDTMIYACALPDGVIKIGCTADLAERRRRIHPEAEVLGFAPGDFADEARIHEGLRVHLDHGREYYRRTPDVLAVVNDLREHLGLEPLDAGMWTKPKRIVAGKRHR